MSTTDVPSPSFSVVTGTTASVRDAVVSQVTYDMYSDPCESLLALYSSQVRIDMNVVATATLTCSLVSVSTLSSGQRSYVWNVTASWTD